MDPQHTPLQNLRRFRSRAVLTLLVCLLPTTSFPQQTGSQDSNQTIPNQQAAAPPDPSTLVAVHGVVQNALTGEPIPRALVQVGGATGHGMLTDADGRFEVDGLAPGPNLFQITRPGFRDAPHGSTMAGVEVDEPGAGAHNVMVAAGMAPLVFQLKPANVIRGQVTLSTDDPANGFQVMLLRRIVQDGLGTWRPFSSARTNSDGNFRFPALEDGEYIVYTEPAMDSELPVTLVDPNSLGRIARDGYPLTFSPDARDFAAAAHIQVRGGQGAQANVRLTLEPFHLVRAELRGPALAAIASSASISPAVQDSDGHQLPYQLNYQAGAHSVQGMLPDGAYTLSVTATQILPSGSRVALTREASRPLQLTGHEQIVVTGRPLTRLHVNLAPEAVSSVQVNLSRTGRGAPGAAQVYIMVTQAGGPFRDGMQAQFASGEVPATLESTTLTPGRYWLHTNLAPGLCEASFLAGSANLGREPLAIGEGGTAPPLTLNLRDDCASLRLALPANVALNPQGEEPWFTVYAVPDFDETTDVTPAVLRPSSGRTFTIQNLTPGAYHVYTFAGPATLEYRNREVLASLGGQAVTLDPASSATLVLETPTP